MKKTLLFMVLGLGLTSVANAQYEPKKGDIATEIGFTPFNTKTGESFKLNEGMFKVRYFLTDKDAIRLKLGVDIDNSSNTQTGGYTPNEIKSATVNSWTKEINNKSSKFSFRLGYERHFAVSGRFDVYAGAEFGYEICKNSGDATYSEFSTTYDSDKKISKTEAKSISAESSDCQIREIGFKDYVKEGYVNTENNSEKNTFVGALFAGVDFYVYKKLYLGAELGISFKSGKTSQSYKDYASSYLAKNSDGVETNSLYVNYSGETATKVSKTYDGNERTEKTTVGTEGNSPISTETTRTELKFYVEPAIRLGWRF